MLDRTEPPEEDEEVDVVSMGTAAVLLVTEGTWDSVTTSAGVEAIEADIAASLKPRPKALVKFLIENKDTQLI